MADPIEFKQIERKIFLSYHEDGLIDLMFGLVFFAFGLGILIDIPYLGAISGAVVIPVYMGLKKMITMPRIGYVQMSEKGRTTKLVLALLTAGLLLFALIVLYIYSSRSGTSSGLATFMQQYGMTFLGGVIALMVIGVALFTGLSRFYLHAMLLFAGFATVDWTDLPWGVGITGLVIILSGFFLMAQFIRRYPVEEA